MNVESYELVGSFNKELEELFDIKLNEIVVCILSKEEFEKFKINEWSVGFYNSQLNKIFVIEEKHSNLSHDEWIKVIKHEMVHLFYVKKFGFDVPKWFFEGIACYLSGQKVGETEVDIKDLIKYSKNIDKDVYKKGYSAVKKLLE